MSTAIRLGSVDRNPRFPVAPSPPAARRYSRPRVPLVVYDPGSDDRLRGSTPPVPVLNIDIAPALLELAGVEVPTTMQGEHLFDLPEIPKHESVRSERFEYARCFEQIPGYEEL